jgi:hypothetical protein
VTLARFRLRPVPWAWLGLLAAGWVPFARLVATAPADPEIGVDAFLLAGLLLGLGAGVLAAPETDPPRDLLRAAPLARWAGLALRLAGWLALGTAAVAAASAWVGPTGGWTANQLARAAAVNFLLTTAVSFLAAGPTSAFGGGLAGLAAALAVEAAGRAWPEGFPVHLAPGPADPGRPWTLAASAALVAAALALEHRTGLGTGPRPDAERRPRAPVEPVP